MRNYGIDIWGNDNFIIKNGKVCINHGNKPSIIDITQKVRASGLRGPLILRFEHLIKKQIDTLFDSFFNAISENSYNGSFNAVFPLKVNQFPNVVEAIANCGENRGYGLEAGSKAELFLAMSYTPLGYPITVNGFKDTELIELGFIAAHSGHNITITIEGLGELETILEVAESCDLKMPNIGIRLRLHSSGSGTWAKSGGMDAKFGLTSTEILEAMQLLRDSDKMAHFKMLHFHIGSQMSDISPLKRALREAGNIYAELKKMGADALDSINIGGGLAVEYSQHTNESAKNYSIEEFANDVVFLLREVSNSKSVEHPNIYTESGRFIVASHAVLIAPVLELFTQDYQMQHIKFKEINPPLLEELRELYDLLTPKNAMEYLHDALDHIESLLTLFDLGYIDLQDRSNAEILAHNIVKKALYICQESPTQEIKKLQERLQERYLINSSIFQSLPDYWGLGQSFPVMPLDRLDQKAIRPASLWDITCDSDGEIGFDPKKPLYLHDVDLDNEEYFLGFFNVGAYQETLGMNHNLFSHPSECSVEITEDGFKLYNIEDSISVMDILDDMGYNARELLIKLKTNLLQSDFITEEEKNDTLQKLENYMYQNGYLRTTR
jgi:arginine decarboxylase